MGTPAPSCPLTSYSMYDQNHPLNQFITEAILAKSQRQKISSTVGAAARNSPKLGWQFDSFQDCGTV